MPQFIKKFNIQLPYNLALPLWAHSQKNQKQDLEDINTYGSILFLTDQKNKKNQSITDR